MNVKWLNISHKSKFRSRVFTIILHLSNKWGCVGGMGQPYPTAPPP